MKKVLLIVALVFWTYGMCLGYKAIGVELYDCYIEPGSIVFYEYDDCKEFFDQYYKVDIEVLIDKYQKKRKLLNIRKNMNVEVIKMQEKWTMIRDDYGNTYFAFSKHVRCMCAGSGCPAPDKPRR